MKYCAELLGKSIKRARLENELTQVQLAAKANIEVCTVINIEKYRGNPKLEVLYSLIKALKIDAREIFNPEKPIDEPAIQHLHFLINDCSSSEAKALVPIIEAILLAIRNNAVENKKS